jgi:ATP-dependent Clp protease ATP-binding subunit ClpA
VLLDDSEGLAGGLIDRAGGNSRAILKATEDALNKLPKVSGSGAGQVYLAPELARAFDAAEKAAEKAGDSFVRDESVAWRRSLCDARRSAARWPWPRARFSSARPPALRRGPRLARW